MLGVQQNNKSCVKIRWKVEYVTKKTYDANVWPFKGHSTSCNEILLRDFRARQSAGKSKCVYQPYGTCCDSAQVSDYIAPTVIYWVVPLPTNSDHQDYYMFCGGNTINRDIVWIAALRNRCKILGEALFPEPTCAMATSGQAFCSSFTPHKSRAPSGDLITTGKSSDAIWKCQWTDSL